MAATPILFLSPAPPDGLHSGLRIRAQQTLEALRQRHTVHSLYLNTGWRWDGSALPRFPAADPGLVLRRTRHALLPAAAVTEWRYFSWLAQGEILARWWRHRYARVHLFRAAMLPFVGPLLRAVRLRVELDLDELESSTRLGLARLAELRGESARARMYEREADYFGSLERLWLPRMERIFVASGLEKARLDSRLPGLPVQVLPNSPRSLPDHPTPPHPASRTLLFVGNLDYFPNRDAVEWLCQEVLPRLRTRAQGWQLLVAGSGSWRPPSTGNVLDAGPVHDLQPLYQNALAALVPIRAGGGTRIKALEAFAYARTAIATPCGIEGLSVQPGREAFVAANAEDFAEQCAHLLSRPALAAEAGLRAFHWVREQSRQLNLVRLLE